MLLLTMNIRHGVGPRVARTVNFIEELRPAVAVLTEYRANSRGADLRAGLHQIGYTHQLAACAEPGKNSVLIASDRAFHAIDLPEVGDSLSHRLLLAQFAGVALAGVYFPQGEAKRPLFKILDGLIVPRLEPLGLILGDFNTGKHYEDEDGRTFACADCFTALLQGGLIDSWRRRNASAREFSWYSSKARGFRVDHALCTPELDSRIRSVRYIHSCREASITDHSALLVEL